MNSTTATKQPMNPVVHAMCTKVAPLLGMLAARWLDEREYENIADYQKRLEQEFDPGVFAVTQMLKRPFGFRFVLLESGAKYEFTVTMRRCACKRIG